MRLLTGWPELVPPTHPLHLAPVYVRVSGHASPFGQVVRAKHSASRVQPDVSTPYPLLWPDPKPPAALAISNVDIQTSESSAHVDWQTNLPSVTQGAYSLGTTPALWTPASPSDVDHETVFTSLAPSTQYTLWLQALDEWGRTATAEVQVSTAAPGQATTATATTDGGAILVGDQPFFPRALWDTCPSDVPKRMLDGINLFMGNACGNESSLLTKLRGQAFSVADASSNLTDVRGLIGWYYPDELDARLPAPVSATTLKNLAVDPPDGMLSFLTLTNHFYSGAAPLPQGRDFYPELSALANVVGFDLYPLQNWCRDDRFAAVYHAQRELESLSNGKPTYQWIEVRRMDCPGGILDPTPQTVEAETWLAIAGGADGIGYFPNNWSDAVGAEIRDLNGTIQELAPALLGDTVAADSNQDPVLVGARTLNGAVYVIAVNSGTTPVEAQIHAPGLGGRTIDVLDEGRKVTASTDDVITDSFAPLAVHIYVAAPPEWNAPGTQ
jgi:hypothetical protein